MAVRKKRIAAYKIIPDDQKILFKVSPGPGKLLRASLVGATIRSVGRLLKACSDNVGADEETFVTGVYLEYDGTLAIEFSVLPRMKEET